MTIQYFIRQEKDDLYYVLFEDENGEIFDADLNGFKTLEEAQQFRDEIQEMQDSTLMENETNEHRDFAEEEYNRKTLHEI